MLDTTTTKVLQVISNKDTITYSIDQKIITNIVKNQTADNANLMVSLIPVMSAIFTLILTKLFDMWSESRKYKIEISKENRNKKIQYLNY